MAAVAIDGPAGAGKSTVARAVADALGFTYVDTGAMYRAVAHAALAQGVDPADGEAVGALAAALDIGFRDGRVYVDDADVTSAIRSDEVSIASALVARHQSVRSALVALQRRAAADDDVVMEGRDISSAVLPDAEVKVFLTASLDERAVRRAKDLNADDLDSVKASIARRDEADSTRAESPLVQAPGAVVVDTTGKAIDEVVAEVVALARGRLG